MTDCAVVSPGNGKDDLRKDDFKIAFDKLFEFANLTSAILEHAGEKSSASMEAFTTIKTFLSDALKRFDTEFKEEDKDILKYCINKIDYIINLQNRMIDIYDDYLNKSYDYVNGIKEFILNEDIERACHYLAEIDYIQYRQMVSIYDFIPKFKYIKKMNNKHLDQFKTRAVKRYLNEFSKGEQKLLESLRSVKFQSNMRELTKEQHIKVAKKDIYKNLATANALARKVLRYPRSIFEEIEKGE